jgi:NAD(P)-dependent dehydrogenase (short-subunit alcohol dehydrogenase family)
MRVLVTGAASGIGRATCLRLARDGQARGRRTGVAALDLQPSAELDGLLRELAALGADPVAVHADVGDPAATRRAVEAAVARLGGLDGLVSNAGISRPGLLVEHSVEDWDRVFAVNTRATLVLVQAARAALAASGGSVVAVASMSGIEPHAHLASYGPSKAALIMLVRVLAQELAVEGVRVNAVSPGMVRTQMTERVYQDDEIATQRAALVPLGRVAAPDDIADVIAFLLSPDARYVTGSNLLADGGITGNLLGRLPGLSRITRR